ncbi:hypothetical protein SAMN04487939_11078 [Lysobacter sp. yr284]|uniref:hypothetical protein n=1 Tax=Lysobacter sp. yr284 TaxID=1761791 RepID=UPI00089A5247|nr:hypothetical protein [Lysobacter sp. yr284]SDY96468.1 hypothetical protein SAMN04487939_11078 [Lysobacter sp. yr284]
MPRKPARKSDRASPQEGVVMPVDAFKALSAFQQELHGIVRTLQPEVLIEIGYPAGQDRRLLREVFQALARRLDPVMAACVWSPAGEDGDGPGASGRLH